MSLRKLVEHLIEPKEDFADPSIHKRDMWDIGVNPDETSNPGIPELIPPVGTAGLHEQSVSTDVNHWIAKVRASTTPEQVMMTVEAFRIWTDGQCAQMSQAYICKLEQIGYPKYEKQQQVEKIWTNDSHGEVIIIGDWSELDQENMLKRMSQLHKEGFSFSVDDSRQLHVQATIGEIPQETINWLREVKAPLITYLFDLSSTCFIVFQTKLNESPENYSQKEIHMHH